MTPSEDEVRGREHWPSEEEALRDAIMLAARAKTRCAVEDSQCPEIEAGWYWTIQRLKDLLRRAQASGEVVKGYIVELDEYAGPDCRYFHRTKGPEEIPEWGIPATLIIHDRHPSTEGDNE